MAIWENGFCSNCKEYAIVEWNECGGEIVLSKHCPHCGAKMEDRVPIIRPEGKKVEFGRFDPKSVTEV